MLETWDAMKDGDHVRLFGITATVCRSFAKRRTLLAHYSTCRGLRKQRGTGYEDSFTRLKLGEQIRP